MSTRFDVHVDTDTAEEGAIASVLASLPMSLVPGHPDTAALQGVAGTTGWMDRALATIGKGASGIAVIAPQPGDTFSLEQLASDHSVPVVLGFLWASNPAVVPASKVYKQAAIDSSLVEMTAYIRHNAATEQVRAELLVLARRLLGPLDDVRTLRINKTGFAVAATLTTSGTPVTLVAVVSNALDNEVRVRMLTKTGCVDLRIPSPDTARPATLKRTGLEGALTYPTIYESSHRATWKRLAALAASGSASSDLAEFRAATANL